MVEYYTSKNKESPQSSLKNMNTTIEDLKVNLLKISRDHAMAKEKIEKSHFNALDRIESSLITDSEKDIFRAKQEKAFETSVKNIDDEFDRNQLNVSQKLVAAESLRDKTLENLKNNTRKDRNAELGPLDIAKRVLTIVNKNSLETEKFWLALKHHISSTPRK